MLVGFRFLSFAKSHRYFGRHRTCAHNRQRGDHRERSGLAYFDVSAETVSSRRRVVVSGEPLGPYDPPDRNLRRPDPLPDMVHRGRLQTSATATDQMNQECRMKKDGYNILAVRSFVGTGFETILLFLRRFHDDQNHSDRNSCGSFFGASAQRIAQTKAVRKTRRLSGPYLIWSASKALTTNTRRLSQPPLLQMPTSSTYTGCGGEPCRDRGTSRGTHEDRSQRRKDHFARPSHSIHKTGCCHRHETHEMSGMRNDKGRQCRHNRNSAFGSW